MRQKSFNFKKKTSNKNKRSHQKNRYGPKGPYKANRHFKENNSSTLQKPELVCQKYDNLLERHLASRRKYYDYFHRSDDNRREKLERNFHSTLEHLRRFESSLNSQQKRWLERKTNNLKLDIIYSHNHDISSDNKTSDPGQANPHLLPSQKETDYSQDSEQSVGTMEDYKKLKGI